MKPVVGRAGGGGGAIDQQRKLLNIYRILQSLRFKHATFQTVYFRREESKPLTNPENRASSFKFQELLQDGVKTLLNYGNPASSDI